MSYNQQTGNYESADGKIVVSNDDVSEARDHWAREHYGVGASDLTPEQYAQADAETLDPHGWQWQEYQRG